MIFGNKHFTTIYDSLFKNIKGLKWYPAVGNNYNSNKYKILIVGESHYDQCESYECSEYKQALKNWSNPNSTRECIIEDRFEFLWDKENKTYRNINSLLSGVLRPIPEAVWENISYYNLVQELLPNINHRPSYDQLLKGIELLSDIVKILKPDLCIIIGVVSRQALSECNNTFLELNNKIRNSKPFKLAINGCSVIAIPHLSRTGFNSLNLYRSCIKNNIPNSTNILDYIADKSRDTLSVKDKDNIFNGKIFNQILLNICASHEELECVDDIHDGTPYFGFKVKDADFRVAFNFWQQDFKHLTAGFYFPNAIPDDKLSLYNTEYSKDGWSVFPYWIFYEVYRLYDWGDLVFDSINDGSIEIILNSIIDNYLIREIPRLKNLTYA